MTLAISVHQVSKNFKIPLDRSATLKHRVVHLRSAGKYRTLKALNDVSFDVEDGEFVGVVGNNGSGKSTLLKILAKIYQPSSGFVVTNSAVSPFLELGVGFDPELTARQNILLNGTILGLTRKELASKMDAVLDFAELHEFADQKVKNFSSGMQVRLAFSVAIQAHAGILLMDEVLAVGDANFQQKCIDVFAHYRREGRTVILVTHDLAAVENYCDRAILLDSGVVIEDGPAPAVVRAYQMRNAERSETNFQEQPAGQGPTETWGTSEVTVASVEVTQPGGPTTHVLNANQPASVHVNCQVHQDIPDIICVMTIRRSDGHTVAESRSPVILLGRERVGDSVDLNYATDHLPLAAGSYQISVSLQDKHASHPYHHVEDATSFKVIDSSGDTGFAVLGGEWRVPSQAVVRSA